MTLILVDREARADRRDLEQHAARLQEVHRFEVEAVDHRRRTRARVSDARAPRLEIVDRRGERHVVDRARALRAVDLRRRGIVGVEAAAVIAAHLPVLALAFREAHRLAEQPLAAQRRVAVRAHALEALQRVLGRDLRIMRAQRLILAGVDHQLVFEALGVEEQQAVLGQLGLDPGAGQPLPPELERLRRGRRATRSGAPSPRPRRRAPRPGTRRTSGPSPASRARRRRTGGTCSVRPG